MNSRTSTAIVFLGLIMTISCSTFTALESIKQNEFANDFVGQQIVDTVLLQQQAGGSADVVVRLLNGLVSDLAKQQREHDQEHSEKNNNWAKLEKEYRAQVKRLTALIKSLDGKIAAKQKAIRLSHHNIRLSQTQIKLVEGKKAGLIAARNADHQASVKRQTRQGEMLKAVNYIIGELNMALKNSNYVQLENIKQELAKLTKENPLQALVQLTMTFNVQSVKFAISKLTEVQVGLTKSVADDVEGERVAVEQFKSLLSQFNSFLSKARKQLAREQALLQKQQGELAALQKQRREAIALKANYNKLIVQLIAARKAYNANYEASKVKRAQETATIKRVIVIISDATPAANRVEPLKFTPKQ